MTLPWWGWTILAAVLALAEMHVPGSYLIWIALGAAVTAGAHALFGFSLEGQVATFALASALCCGGGYFVYRRADAPQAEDSKLNRRDQMLVGGRGVVVVPIAGGQGKVRLGDSTWLAEGPDLEEGTPVVVRSVRGTRVVVEPLARA